MIFSSVVGILSWNTTPTLAEKQREELGKRLSSFGIRLSDNENSSSPLEDKERDKGKEKGKGMNN